MSFCPIWKVGSWVTPLLPLLFLPRLGATASSDRTEVNRSSSPPRSSPSSSSSSEVLEIAESVTGAGRLCPFSLEIWVLDLNLFIMVQDVITMPTSSSVKSLSINSCKSIVLGEDKLFNLSDCLPIVFSNRFRIALPLPNLSVL